MVNGSIFPLWCTVLTGNVEAELLHTYSKIEPYDTLILCVRLAVLTAVTLTVPIVLFPVSIRVISQTHPGGGGVV